MSIAPGVEPDADITALLRQGTFRDAFTLLLPRYRDRVFRLALAMLRERAHAEDVAQDTFLRIWQALPRFDGRSSLATWIYAIARNGCLSELRRRRPVVSIDAAAEDEREALEARSAEGQDGDGGGRHGGAGGSGHDADAEIDVAQLLGGLPERMRQVVTLFYLEDQSHEQTGEALGMPAATVKATLYRARLKLAELAGAQRAQSSVALKT